jgi:hypothetical protein
MRILILFALAVLCSSGLDATSTSGRFTTALYSFERAFQDTATTGSLRAYQTGRLKLTRLASRPELSFQTYGRLSHDFQDDRLSDPAYRLYHAYFRWKDERDRFRVTVGRQTIFAGVGVGRLDGARLRLSSGSRIRVDVYGGALVYGGREGVRAPNRASMVGGHVLLTDIGGATVGASLFRRSRKVDPYDRSTRISDWPTGSEILAGEVEQQMIGLDLSRNLGRAEVKLRWDLSTPHGLETRRIEGDVRYRKAGWTVSGTFLHRTPYVDQNSIFAVFTQSSNREVAFRASRRVNRHFGVYSELSRVAYDGADGFRANLGIRVLNGTIGYTRRSGFGGEADGVNGMIRYRLGPSMASTASVGWTRFRTYSGTDVRSRVFSSTLGFTYRPARHLSVSLQGQSLSQELRQTSTSSFPGAGHDFRLFLSASTWFFKKGTP